MPYVTIGKLVLHK